MWGNFNFNCNCMLWWLLVHTSEMHLFLQLRVCEVMNGREVCVMGIGLRSPAVPLESSVIYLYCPPYFPSPCLFPLCNQRNYCLWYSLYVKHFSYPQNSSTSACFYFVLLFLFVSFVSLHWQTWGRTSAQLCCCQSCGWGLYLTCAWQLCGGKTSDTGMTVAPRFRKTQNDHFVNRETRMAVVMDLLQIQWGFFPWIRLLEKIQF